MQRMLCPAGNLIRAHETFGVTYRILCLLVRPDHATACFMTREEGRVSCVVKLAACAIAAPDLVKLRVIIVNRSPNSSPCLY